MLEIFESSYGSTLIQLFLINLFSVMSPGPDFAIVMRNSLVYNRRSGFITAVGTSMGETIHASYTILGVGILIAQNILLLTAVKIMGCAYLIYLGINMLRSQKSDIESYKNQYSTEAISDFKAFQNGLFTNILNPNAIIFFVSMFSVIVDANTPLHILLLYAMSIVMTSFLWYSLVAILFSNKIIRNMFFKAKHWIERFVGSFLIIMSIKLLLTKES